MVCKAKRAILYFVGGIIEGFSEQRNNMIKNFYKNVNLVKNGSKRRDSGDKRITYKTVAVIQARSNTSKKHLD